MVVLKRLSDAVRDGDRVLAVVRGSAVNQDGRSNGLMAPNPAAQMAVLRAAYRQRRRRSRSEVDYVEAHGTGTLLGDPIEARALGTVLGRGRPESSPLLIGAVKSNLGHLEAAAGVAGFIKAVLAVQRGHIPANLDFETPNPHIPFDDLRLKVVADHHDWPSTDASAAGGGVVVRFRRHECACGDRAGAGSGSRLPVSTDAERRCPRWWCRARRPSGSPRWPGCWPTGWPAPVPVWGWPMWPTRSTITGAGIPSSPRCVRVIAPQAVAGLRALAAGRPATGWWAAHEGPCGPGTVFVYSGQGSQWAGMGRQLLADEPAFAAAVAELEPVFVEQVGFSLQQVLADGEPVSGDARVQPVIMGLQLALTELWRSYGVDPDAVIGHSMGEVTAAVVAGALTAAEGLRVIATRSRLMSRLAGQGAVALLELDAEATERR